MRGQYGEPIAPEHMTLAQEEMFNEEYDKWIRETTSSFYKTFPGYEIEGLIFGIDLYVARKMREAVEKNDPDIVNNFIAERQSNLPEGVRI